jgi:outer membrane protein insertion porin family
VKLSSILAVALVGLGLLHDPAAAGPRPQTPAAKVRFTGNHTIASDRLRTAISEYPLFDDTGTIIDEVLERDLLVIAGFYWDHGHANVKVGEPVIPPSRDAVTIPIEEGPVFTIGPVAVTGELLGTAKDDLARIRVRRGLTFSRSMIANDRQALSDFYQDQGYAYANVLPLTKIDLDRRTIGLTFEITRGKRATFERIEIHGNTRTPTHTLRRALGVVEGDGFTNRQLVEGKRRLEALGVGAIAISTRQGSSDEHVVVTVEVEE